MSARIELVPAAARSDGPSAAGRLVFAAATLGGGLAGVALERAFPWSAPSADSSFFVGRHPVAAIVASLGFFFGLAYRSRAGRAVRVWSLFERVLFAAGLTACFGALIATLGLGKAFQREYGAPAALVALALAWAGVIALGRESASPRVAGARNPPPEPQPALAAGADRAESLEGAEGLAAAFRSLCRTLEQGSRGVSANERAELELQFRHMLAHLMRSPHAEALEALAEAVRLDSIGASQLRAQAIELLAASPNWPHIEVLLEALPRDLPVIAAQAIHALADRLDPFHEDELAALAAHRDPFVARMAAAVMARRAGS